MDTPLHEAVRAGHMETIFFLVKEAKVDTKVSNEDQETPVDLAQCLQDSDPEVYGQIINFLNSVPAARNQSEKIEPFFYPFKVSQKNTFFFFPFLHFYFYLATCQNLRWSLLRALLDQICLHIHTFTLLLLHLIVSSRANSELIFQGKVLP